MTDTTANTLMESSTTGLARKSNSVGGAQAQSCMAFLLRTLTIQRWIEKVINESNAASEGSPNQTLVSLGFTNDRLIFNQLVDGVVLCKLMSAIKPDSIPRIHPPGTLNFKIRENILFFVQALEEIGISKVYQFQVNDLFERKNFYKVLEALEILADVASGPGYEGKSIDQLTPEEEASITFTEPLIAETEALLKKLNQGQVKRAPLKKSLFVNEPKRLTSHANPLRNSMTSPAGAPGANSSSFLRNSKTIGTGVGGGVSGGTMKRAILSEAQIIEKATPYTKTWTRVQSLVRGYKVRVMYRKRVRMAAYRHKIVKELLQTEEVYVNNLEHLSKYYFAPIKKESSKLNIKLEHFTLQLSNLDVIINYNRKLLGMIQPKVQHWSNNQRIGDVFKQFTLYLKVYTQYVKEYNKIFDVINNYRKNNSKFEAFITEKEYSDPLKSIGTYLILPIQRIPRYTLLLENVVKNTWEDHADYADLSESLKKMLDVASYVNEKTRDAENIVKVTEIQNNFVGKFDNLAEPHRRFVYEGPLNVIANGKESNRIFYLFNDFLIGTKPITSGLVKRKVQLKVKESIRLNLVNIRNVQEQHSDQSSQPSNTTTTTNSTNNHNNNNNSTTSPPPSSSSSKPMPINKFKSSSSQSLMSVTNNTTQVTASPTSKSQIVTGLSNSMSAVTPTTPSTMKPPKPAPPPRRDLKLSSSPLSTSTGAVSTSPTLSSTSSGESSSAGSPALQSKPHTSSFSRISSPLPQTNNNLTIGENRNQQRISSPTPGSAKPNHASYSSGSSGAGSLSSSGSNSAHSTPPRSMTPITASPSTSQEKLIDEIRGMAEEKKLTEEKRLAEEKKMAVEAEKQASKAQRNELVIELTDSFGTVILRLLCKDTKDKEHWMSLFKKVQEEIDTKKSVNDESIKRAQEKASLAINALSQQYATLRVKGKTVGYSTIKGMMSSASSGEDGEDEGAGATEQPTQLPGESNYQMYRRLTLGRKAQNPTKEGATVASTGTEPKEAGSPNGPTPLKPSTSKEDLSLSSGDEATPNGEKKEKKSASGWFSSLRKKKKVPSIQETFGHLETNIAKDTNPTATPTPGSTPASSNSTPSTTTTTPNA